MRKLTAGLTIALVGLLILAPIGYAAPATNVHIRAVVVNEADCATGTIDVSLDILIQVPDDEIAEIWFSMTAPGAVFPWDGPSSIGTLDGPTIYENASWGSGRTIGTLAADTLFTITYYDANSSASASVEVNCSTGAYAIFSSPASPAFPDVPDDYWAYAYVEAIYYAGVTTGYPDGTFRPSDPVNRGEIAVFLKKALHGPDFTPPAPDGSHPFSDIAGHWAEAWIEESYDEGLTEGFPDGTYRPNAEVSRAQIAVFLLRTRYGTAYSPPPPSGGVFSDISGHWAEAWIEALASEGIASGYPDGTYRPEISISRAEMAVLLTNTFSLTVP